MKRTRILMLLAVGSVFAVTLAACAPAGVPPPSTPVAPPEAPTGVNWRQFEGSTLNILLVSHPFVDALQPLLPEFEELTGIDVTTEVLSEVPAFEKLIADLSSGAGTYDLFMTDPLHNWQFAAGGWLEPLDEYLDDTSLTDLASYDLDDFAPGIWAAGRWNLQPLQGIGEGPLWAVPINYETYLLAYRPEVLDACGGDVPETYEEVLEVAGKCTFEYQGQQIYGVITRFDKYWDLPYLTFGTMLQSYGVSLLDENGNVAIDSPESIAATRLFIEIIKAGSPEGAATFTWYEALQGFASGQYALSLDEADLFAPVYEDPEQSQVAGNVGYALVPRGPTGERKSGLWVWQMSINAASRNKKAAWLFLEWLTSKETMVKTHLGGNMNPVRLSAWDDPRVAALIDVWGEEPGQYRRVAQEMATYASIGMPPHPELTRILDRWAEAIQQSYFDDKVEENLQAAKEDIEETLAL